MSEKVTQPEDGGLRYGERMHNLVAEDAGDYGWDTWNGWQQRIVKLAWEADLEIAALKRQIETLKR